MKKLAILFISIFILTSCNKEDYPDNQVDDPVIEEKDTDTYVFESIKYYYENVNDLKISAYKDSTIYANDSEAIIEITIEPNETVLNRTSQFFPDEKPDVNFETNSLLKISIPNESSKDSFIAKKNQWFSIRGSEQWVYSEEKMELPYSGSTITGKNQLHPHTKIYATHYYNKYDLLALYKATFIGKESGKKIEVSGKWRGQWYSFTGETIGELKN